MLTKQSVMVRVNTPVMTMMTGSVKCMSIRWKALGRSYAPGCVPIAGSRKKSYRCIWGFFQFVHNAKKRGKALLSALLENRLAFHSLESLLSQTKHQPPKTPLPSALLSYGRITRCISNDGGATFVCVSMS